MAELKLPSLGEGIEKGTIISIMVEIGDTIAKEQSLLEVETDKVVVEVPADAEGEITAILVNVGDEITEGQPFIQLNSVGSISKKTSAEKKGKSETIPEPQPNKIIQQNENMQQMEMVAVKEAAPSLPMAPVKTGKFRASPLARKLAREIGIDITAVSSITSNGRISVKDVKAYAKQMHSNGAFAPSKVANVKLPDFSKWGTITRQAMPAITLATSKNMSTAWSQIPHAWLQEKVDVTDLEAKRQMHKTSVKEQGGALTITSILVKVVAKVLEEFPVFNASLDIQTNEIIFKEYINIGVAVDSDRGLLVPVLRDANKKGMLQVAKDLVDLSQKVKQKKTKPEELEGGTFTISNLGGIGTSAIFPLVNHPQVAILGVAASETEARWINRQFEPRSIMPLTIGFDHRIINGADAARFLKYTKELLEDWFLWSM